MAKRKNRIFVGDFETTVFEGQEYTEVWASACVELGTEDVKIFHSIDEQWNYYLSLNVNLIVYYHNLKFDGNFWLSFLLDKLHYTTSDNGADLEHYRFNRKFKEMKNKTFCYSISAMGQWYAILIKANDKLIEIRDSLKLLPFSVKEIGEGFATKHKKLDIEYKGFRYAGCEITDKEKEYIANDVLVVKEAIEILYFEGNDRLTIGSCCMNEFKKFMPERMYEKLFPDLYEIPVDKSIFGSETAGEYIRRSYRGGWCYVVKGKENRLYKNGLTLDVNSLYPSMMHSESGNRYPIGLPVFWKGNEIPAEALRDSRYFFVRIRTRFYLKQGYLPFVQVKHNLLYPSNRSLETSDIKNSKDGRYYKEYIDFDGSIKQAVVEMTLTKTDYILLKEHYNLTDFEILDGCYFRSTMGIFDRYIDKYKKIKLESKGAQRQLAKLFLNNLYGQMAKSKDSSFKVAFLDEENVVQFVTVNAYEKQPGYIAIGSAITSYARNFTIRAAQKNYYGTNKPGFIYADTDSIHCDLSLENLKGVEIDDKNFCCWKLEREWEEGLFVRQKTYIEKEKDGGYKITCAGMPEKSKNLFLKSMEGYSYDKNDDYTDDERQFLKTKRIITDFKMGLTVPGKLMPKRIRGGVVLVDTIYQIR